MALQLRSTLSAGISRPSLARRVSVCRASQQDGLTTKERVKAAAVAGLVAGVLLSSAVVPEEALAARSGGRVSSSSGFSSRRSAPAAKQAPRATVNNYSTTVVAAPPIVASPFGFGFGMPFFGGGYGYGMPMVMPVPFLGGMLQIFLLLAVLSFVANVVRGAINAANTTGKKKDDDTWDSL